MTSGIQFLWKSFCLKSSSDSPVIPSTKSVYWSHVLRQRFLWIQLRFRIHSEFHSVVFVLCGISLQCQQKAGFKMKQFPTSGSELSGEKMPALPFDTPCQVTCHVFFHCDLAPLWACLTSSVLYLLWPCLLESLFFLLLLRQFCFDALKWLKNDWRKYSDNFTVTGIFLRAQLCWVSLQRSFCVPVGGACGPALLFCNIPGWVPPSGHWDPGGTLDESQWKVGAISSGETHNSLSI